MWVFMQKECRQFFLINCRHSFLIDVFGARYKWRLQLKAGPKAKSDHQFKLGQLQFSQDREKRLPTSTHHSDAKSVQKVSKLIAIFKWRQWTFLMFSKQVLTS